jgi:hypothetical protein
MSILGNAKEVARPSVQECVGCRGRRGQNDSVDDVGKNRDRGALHRNDPWGRLSAFGIIVGKLRVVTRNDYSNEKGTEDVEEQNTLVDG